MKFHFIFTKTSEKINILIKIFRKMLSYFKFLIIFSFSNIVCGSNKLQRGSTCLIINENDQVFFLRDDNQDPEEVRFSDSYEFAYMPSQRNWEFIPVPNSYKEYLIRNHNGKYLYEFYDETKPHNVLATKMSDISRLNDTFKWTFHQPRSSKRSDLFKYVNDFNYTKVVDFFEISNVHSWKLLTTESNWLRNFFWLIESLQGKLVTSYSYDKSLWSLRCLN